MLGEDASWCPGGEPEWSWEPQPPSRVHSPPFCPRLSRLPSPSSQELRTSPLRWLLSGSPCTGPFDTGQCPHPLHHAEPQGPQCLLARAQGSYWIALREHGT